MYLSKISMIAFASFAILLGSSFTTAHATVKLPDQDPEVMSAGLFKIQGRLNAVIDHFDFDFKCGITSFRMVRVAKSSDPVVVENKGSNFSTATLRLVDQAKAGDYYFFEDIRAKCEGDPHTRKLAMITLKIK